MRNLPPENAWEQWLTLSLKSNYYPIFVGHPRVQVNLYQDDCFVNLYSSILVNLFQDKTRFFIASSICEFSKLSR